MRTISRRSGKAGASHRVRPRWIRRPVHPKYSENTARRRSSSQFVGGCGGGILLYTHAELSRNQPEQGEDNGRYTTRRGVGGDRHGGAAVLSAAGDSPVVQGHDLGR